VIIWPWAVCSIFANGTTIDARLFWWALVALFHYKKYWSYPILTVGAGIVPSLASGDAMNHF